MKQQKTYRKENGSRLWSLKRDLPLAGFVVVLIISVLISALVYVVMRNFLYSQYNIRLEQAITYVENNADVDDLKQCVETGVSSQKRDELQQFVNTMIDDLGLSYIYIARFNGDRMVNVVSATNAEERANGETDMPFLFETDAYSLDELKRYSDCWNKTEISYFEETSEYGEYYTACKPLRDKDGNTVAVLCIDVSSHELHRNLLVATLGTVGLLILVVVVVGFIAIVVLKKKAIEPIVAIAGSAQDLADKSKKMTNVAEMEYVQPEISTKELQILANSLSTMATSLREYITKTVEAETIAQKAKEENIRLAEKAEADAKINRLTESVRSMFDNMPAMTFSKDVNTGKYLACNMLFADYAGLSDVGDVVGRTDRDLFDETTAKHFEETDRIALAKDTPYLYEEEVNAPDGKPRQFQTTKIKFVDGQGRLCILGMCSDTTELMMTRKQSQQAQAAYEEARTASLTYGNIARALALDYSYLYYVDLKTNQFWEYRSDLSSENLAFERRGEDFFTQSLLDARTVIYPADQDNFFGAFTRENILDTIDKYGMFTLSYRMMVNNVPTYVNMKITRMVDDFDHLVVGVNNVDAQMRIQEEVERAKEERITFSRIAALTSNYICIYTVDPVTDHFIEYNVASEYAELSLPKEGEHFFDVSQKGSEKYIYIDDRKRFSEIFTKDNVLKEIETNGVFTVEYRLLLNGVPTYVRTKAAIVEEVDGPQMVIGISDIDAQIKREQEYVMQLTNEHKKANADALTGLQNKHAYVDLETVLNRDIEDGKEPKFALVVLDINGLKTMNDTQGHRKGDALIIQATKIIKRVFAKSSVFRVGGDEFAVIAQGEDYDNIDELVEKIAQENAENLVHQGVVIACGMARYDGDNRVSSVFERADINMYDNKKFLKKNSF